MTTRYYKPQEYCAQENVRENLVGSYMKIQFTSPDVNNSRSLETNINKLKEDKIIIKLKNDANIIKDCPLDVVSASFIKQPPDNLRKSNFFHFDLSFTDTNGNQILVEKGNFIGFQEDKEDEKPLRNGIKYRLNLSFSTGKKQVEDLLVRLIDSSSKKPISYDGQDKNPDMCRVLLTHEVMCSRCCDSKSCGNRNETPSDPVLMANNTITRYHMKCNQNCLKNAGNPRETRRFQVQVSFLRKNEILTLATSENMFVHNNSKHGRRPGSVCETSISSSCSDLTSKLPMIHHLIPKEGKLSGCDEIAIVGENFFEGMQIVFGNQLGYRTEVLSSTVIRAISPPCNGSVIVEIKCVHGCRIIQKGTPPHFKYSTELYDNQIDFQLERLWNLLPKQSTDVEKPSKDLILRRVVELFECLYVNSPVLYNSYENGYESVPVNNGNIQPRVINNTSQTSISNMVQPNNYIPNGKDGKSSNTNSRPSMSSNNGFENLTNSSDYVRHSMVNNNQPNFDNIGNNGGGGISGGYIVGPMVVGMGQMCDQIGLNNPPNFYLPYPGASEQPSGGNLGFPLKRQFTGLQHNNL